jgi:hypothetical protein
VLAAALALGCGAREQPLVERFFSASRLYDRTALAQFATVVFNPATDGIVRTFEIVSVSAERPVPRETWSRAAVDLSLRHPDGTQPDATEASVKDVTVSAPVQTPDGQTVQKTLVVTLQRARAGEETGQWVVVGVTP